MIGKYLKTEFERFVPEGVHYIDFLRILARELHPQAYLEIGTSGGHSVAATQCDALCIDPKFQIGVPVLDKRAKAFFFQMTSDDFFRTQNVRHFFPSGPDVCFLDGLHRFEFLLRDFINVEMVCHRSSLILIHDCLPVNARMAEREMRVDEAEDVATRAAWTGDVWRILLALKKYRPEMRVLLLDCGPTGLVACSGLDPLSDALRKNYGSIVDEMTEIHLESFTIGQLWQTFPVIDTVRLCQNPNDFTAIFNVY